MAEEQNSSPISENQWKKDDILMQIRDKLRKDNLKLWMEPYYVEPAGGPSDSHLNVLAKDYSSALNIQLEETLHILYELQRNSLENLRQSHRFKESGVATLKVKVLQQSAHKSDVYNIEVPLLALGSTLKERIKQQVKGGLAIDQLKLICAGKVLEDGSNLISQGVKNGQQIMALIVGGSVTDKDTPSIDRELQQLERMRTDNDLLAVCHDRLHLEDQFGRTVQIPAQQRKQVVMALSWHEKGRTALKRGDHSRALVFLLEAEHGFNQCQLGGGPEIQKLLQSVDNYALLDLDIAWCYLQLRSVANLPEAYERLQRCEHTFQQTYGPNLERLVAVRGADGATNERALFMRLHLLQGIALYHRNERRAALKLLHKARSELATLKVDETSVVLLVELGYSVGESRLGLRASGGDINAAANYINEQREVRREGRQKAKEEDLIKRAQEKLGKCADGVQYVDANFLRMLTDMGYQLMAAKSALAACNNVISDAIQYISENPAAGPSTTVSSTTSTATNPVEDGSTSTSQPNIDFWDLAAELTPLLEASGFNLDSAKTLFDKHRDELLGLAAAATTNSNDAVGQKLMEMLEKEVRTNEEFQRFTEDLSMVDDDYLNLTLDEEEDFLNQYLRLLER